MTTYVRQPDGRDCTRTWIDNVIFCLTSLRPSPLNDRNVVRIPFFPTTSVVDQVEEEDSSEGKEEGKNEIYRDKKGEPKCK